ncbi:MAG: Gfo/Idh/MocA family oxidoreductase [Phycisphaerae bacterium]|nr:Gfo/Idh/MocA family oxidoreductase [Phycisphaerae bacterium]
MSQPKEPNRRDFLKRTAAVAGAGLATVKSPRLARASASERVRIGAIGTGGMCNHHLGQLMKLKEEGLCEVTAVCDVFSNRLEAAAAKTGGKPYKNWKDVINSKDVDAVLIATPDHWHAPMTIAAAKAGKDIYCEKPMTHWDQLDLAKQVVEAVAENKRVMQVGTQFMSDDVWDLAKANLAKLGKIIHVQSSDCRNGPIGCYSPKSNDPAAVPGKTLDWDMWLGCDETRVPKRPYEPGRFFAFRSFWDYSGGVGTDFFPHILTPWVSTLDLKFPKRIVQAGGQYYWDDGREVADIVNMCLDYEGGPTVMVLGALATDQNLPWLIRGQKAAFEFNGPSSPLKIVPEKAAGGGETTELKGKQHWDTIPHWRDFLSCVKTRKKTRSHEELGYRVMVALSAGIKSYRSGKAMTFDAGSGKVCEI